MEYKVGSETINGRKYTVTINDDDNQYKEKYYREIDDLRIAVGTLGARLGWDTNVRRIYTVAIQKMSQNIENQIQRGKITYRQGYLIANKRRNFIMDAVREVTHSIGLSFAKEEKPEGKTARALLSHYAITEHVEKTIELPSHLTDKDKKNIIREEVKKMKKNLTSAQQKKMYLDLPHKEKEIIIHRARKAAGDAQKEVLERLKEPPTELPKGKTNMFGGKTDIYGRVNKTGRYLFYLSISISIYNILTANDKVAAAEHEAILQGVMFVGGWTAGTVGAALGGPPGAYIGAMVGSTLAVYLTDSWLKHNE
ncbi:unnamed protein product [Commensalibacter communis]|uniref:hypothetical protein n=1 Tax=Commensalibacter communis TaxID=2972786 RepID=UPI0022FFAEE8|nr:hypothetical protein [Commensalibacter communis]CAI3951645.1 unnamed protein product [Commensalibacter communis]